MTHPDPAELKAQNRALSARNKQLAELLKSSRDKLKDLNAQVEALGDPAPPPVSYTHLTLPTIYSV